MPGGHWSFVMRVQFDYEAQGEEWEVSAEVAYDPGYAAEVEIGRVIMYRPDSYTEIEIEDIEDKDLKRIRALAIEAAAENE